MSTYKTISSNDVKLVAAKIETLSKELQSRLSGSGDILSVSQHA